MVSGCRRCGLPMHPDLTKCEVCGETTASESNRRNRLFFSINTIAISFVAIAVVVRTLTAGDIAVGMSQSDCQHIQTLTKQTRYAVESLSSDPERAVVELANSSSNWLELSEKYVPGKFSWSTSGLEHNWLERLASATGALSMGETPEVEGELDPKAYVLELVKLAPRFCS
jgi:hypothetical protein